MYHYIASHTQYIAIALIVLTSIVISSTMILIRCHKRIRELEKVGFFDPLTELGNKLLLEEKAAYTIINQAILDNQSGVKGDVSAFFITLNDFKTIADRSAKNFILESVAANIESSIRPSDYCFTISYGEFLIVASGLGEDERAELADTVEAFVQNIGMAYDVTAHIEIESASINTIAVNSNAFRTLVGIPV